MIRSLALAGLAVIALAAPTLAGYCKPTTPPVIDPTARIADVCGDPRVTIVLDNSTSTGPVRYHVSYRRGQDHKRVIRNYTVPAGAAKTLWRRWVMGSGSHMWVSASGVSGHLLDARFGRGEHPCVRLA